MPLTPEERIDGKLLVSILKNAVSNSICFLERSQAMPKQGVVSMFKYGITYGIILASFKYLTLLFKKFNLND